MQRSFEDLTILIVEDDENLREAMVQDFQFRGSRVLAAPDGVEGYEVILKNPVDVVISDMRMANGGGLALLDKLKKRDPFSPVMILVSGYSDLSLEEMYDHGADGFFTKPYKRDRFISQILKEVQEANLRWKELAAERPISVKLHFESFEKALSSKMIGLGRGGIYFEHPGLGDALDQEIGFEISLDQPEPRVLRGTGIVRTNRALGNGTVFGCGVEFVSLDPEAREFFIARIQELRPRAYLPR